VILYAVCTNDLNTHYRQLLSLGDDWDVVEVDLDLSANRVTIDLQHAGALLGHRSRPNDLCGGAMPGTPRD
jgi:transposase